MHTPALDGASGGVASASRRSNVGVRGLLVVVAV